MLKKLFISLLILSALTSEGIAVIPDGLLNVYLFPGSNIDVFRQYEAVPEQVREDTGTSSLFASACSNAAYTAPDDNIGKYSIKDCIKASDIETDSNKAYSSINLLKLSSAFSCRDIVMQQSDISPPGFNL